MLLKVPVQNKFNSMVERNTTLYRTDVTGDKLWETYLNSFPPELNPIYKKRTVHDCAACKQFIRSVGNVVAIVNNELISIWDVQLEPNNPMQAVAIAMSDLVCSKSIQGIFKTNHINAKVGVDQNFAVGEDKTNIITYKHFCVTVPDKFLVAADALGTILSEARVSHDLLYRALNEITKDSIETVLELIAQNSLYRGVEYKFSLDGLLAAKLVYDRLPTEHKDFFIWQNYLKNFARIKNSAIGTLLVALSQGEELDSAVKAFETMVAPANYKRPTALVTKEMVNRAKKQIEELGLTSALARRYATESDLTINNVLFRGSNFSKSISSTDIFDEVATKSKPQNFSKVEEITMENFIEKVLPTTTQLEVLFENRHKNRLVSLIAPEDPDSKNLFKWDNKFSWSYTGDLADHSNIKEKVKIAGGNVTGDFRASLEWYNYDDLDLHLKQPGNYRGISWRDKHDPRTGGSLDVDMNAGVGHTREPVENIVYPQFSQMPNGSYRLSVNQFSKRENQDVGFKVEVQILDEVYNFEYPKAVSSYVIVADFTKTESLGISITPHLPLISSGSSKKSEKIWNILTEEFNPVKALMLSPNYWGNEVTGNKHYMFMLENCLNDGKARGFYNEFLSNSLHEYRKVMEVVGSKVRTNESPDQLSGLGFSATQPGEVIVRVTGASKRLLKIKI